MVHLLSVRRNGCRHAARQVPGAVVVDRRQTHSLYELQQAFLAAAREGVPSERAGASWAAFKALRLSEAVSSRFPWGLRQNHDKLQVELCHVWKDPTQLSADARCWLLQLSRYNWSSAYEALAAAFTFHCDCIAARLRQHLQPAAHPDCQCSGQDCGEEGAGLELWKALERECSRYRAWLGTACGMCLLLVEKVAAQRGAELHLRDRPATPSLRELGLLIFRSQVVLAHGIREQLQTSLMMAGLSPMSGHVAADVAAAHLLVADLDVPDDAAAPPHHHTQCKLRRCFRMQLGNALIPANPRKRRHGSHKAALCSLL
eukprot:jgi/Botrbrau1/11038/Bobra.92_2s0010.2